MGAVTTQDLQDLFKECPSLPRKLSNQEIRGLKNFVDKRAQADYIDLVQDVTFLEMSRNHAQRQYSRAKDELRRESAKDRNLVQEYKRSLESINKVLSNKEERFEGKYEQLLKDVDILESQLRSMREGKLILEDDIKKKDFLVEELYGEISKMKDAVDGRSDYQEIVQESEKMRREILRLKLELDRQKKENTALLRQIDELSEGYKSSKFADSGISSRQLQPKSPTSFAVSDKLRAGSNTPFPVIPKSVGFKSSSYSLSPAPYGCSAPDCRARKDLEECRAKLARKYQENAYLSYLLAEARGNNRDNISIKRLGLDYYTPRLSAIDHKSSPLYSSPLKTKSSYYK